MRIRIATRESRLALWQARHIASLLERIDNTVRAELVPMTTSGDRQLEVTLSKIGGKGLFIKELEQAMLDDRADIAVHSMKDVPAHLPEGFVLAAITERHDPRDALVGSSLDSLPRGARVGTSSLRRQAQLKLARPDLQIEPVRGNVDTRLSKLDGGQFDAIMLAVAGLERLGLGDRIAEVLDPAISLPAIGQGAIGIECREDCAAVTVLQQLDHYATSQAVTAERALSEALEASCTSPLAGLAFVEQDEILLHSVIAHPQGSDAISAMARGTDPQRVGREAAQRMLRHGARSLLDESFDVER